MTERESAHLNHTNFADFVPVEDTIADMDESIASVKITPDEVNISHGSHRSMFITHFSISRRIHQRYSVPLPNVAAFA